MRDSKRDPDVKNRLLDSVGEGKDGMRRKVGVGLRMGNTMYTHG